MKRIAVFTSTRAEYGLLRPLLRLLADDARYEPLLLAGGSHLSKAHGRTIDQIRADGIPIWREIPFLPETPGPTPEASALSLLCAGMGQCLADGKPDLLILLGDRYELLAAAAVALVAGTPIAHISGGDITEGSFDNQVRHALTKLAHLHFPANEKGRGILERMGEEPWRICVSGEPGLDGILALAPTSKDELFRDLGLDPGKETVVATFHPETIANDITPGFLEETVRLLTATTPYQYLFTAANFDPGGEALNERLRTLSQRAGGPRFVASLGQQRYYSLLKYAKAMIGNSSSALTEAQSFDLPAVDVGKRQQGRLANANVLHCPANPGDLVAAVELAVSRDFEACFTGKPNLYGDGRAAPRILGFLDNLDDPRLLMKRNVFA